MLLLPFAIAFNQLVWGLFIALVAETNSQLVLIAVWTWAMGGLLWIVHEAVILAFTPLDEAGG